MDKKVDVVIPYCSYDSRFIQHVIDGIKSVSNNIIIVYSDLLFNGVPENEDEIQQLILRNPECKFVKNKVNLSKSSRWNHNNARWIGYEQTTMPYILFLNADEVFESDKLYKWLNTKMNWEDVMYFSNYWYFRDAKFQSVMYEETPVITNRKIISKDIMFTEDETNVFKRIIVNSISRNNVYFDGKPMCHHYSWVLSKDEMLAKVMSWGHNIDRNWKALVEEEFSRPFNGTDFVHGYRYNILEKSYI